MLYDEIVKNGLTSEGQMIIISSALQHIVHLLHAVLYRQINIKSRANKRKQTAKQKTTERKKQKGECQRDNNRYNRQKSDI